MQPNEQPDLQEQIAALRRQLDLLGMNHRLLVSKVGAHDQRLASHQNWLAELHADVQDTKGWPKVHAQLRADIADLRRALTIVGAKSEQLDGRVGALEDSGEALSAVSYGAALSDARARLLKLESICKSVDGYIQDIWQWIAKHYADAADIKMIRKMSEQLGGVDESLRIHDSAIEAFGKFMAAHNDITASVRRRLGAQEQAMTEAESRIADLEGAVFEDVDVQAEADEAEQKELSPPYLSGRIESVRIGLPDGNWFTLFERSDATQPAASEQVDALPLRGRAQPRRCADGCCPVCVERGVPCHKCGHAPAAQ